MANVTSNQSLVAIIADLTSYGGMQTNLSGALAMTDVTCEIKKGIILTETMIKTGTLAPMIKEKILTGSDATVTIKGNLCSEYSLLLAAYTLDSSSPYTLQTTQPANFTYNIYKLNAVGSSASDTPYDYALGCFLIDWKLTGQVNGIWQFESTWAGKSATFGSTTALTNEPSAYAAGTPFLFGNTTCTLHNSKATMNSCNISLTKNRTDEKNRYQNSMTPNQEIMTGYIGTIEVATIYDNAADPAINNAIGSQTAVACVITLVNAAYTWAFTFACRIADFNAPDAGKDLYEANATLDIAADAVLTTPMSVTVTAL